MFLNLKYVNDEYIINTKKLWKCEISKTEIKLYLNNSKESVQYIYIKMVDLVNRPFDELVIKVKDFLMEMGNLLLIIKDENYYYLDINQIDSYVFNEISLGTFPEKFKYSLRIGLYNGWSMTLSYSPSEKEIAKTTNNHIKNVLKLYHKKDKNEIR